MADEFFYKIGQGIKRLFGYDDQVSKIISNIETKTISKEEQLANLRKNLTKEDVKIIDVATTKVNELPEGLLMKIQHAIEERRPYSSLLNFLLHSGYSLSTSRQILNYILLVVGLYGTVFIGVGIPSGIQLKKNINRVAEEQAEIQKKLKQAERIIAKNKNHK